MPKILAIGRRRYSNSAPACQSPPASLPNISAVLPVLSAKNRQNQRAMGSAYRKVLQMLPRHQAVQSGASYGPAVEDQRDTKGAEDLPTASRALRTTGPEARINIVFSHPTDVERRHYQVIDRFAQPKTPGLCLCNTCRLAAFLDDGLLACSGHFKPKPAATT